MRTGRDWEGRFAEFDFEPIAAASIGQVHQAVASDGRQLALKIQYPGVAKSIDSDVDNLATALRLSNILPRDVDVSDLLVEVKRELHREVDYIREARNLQRYAELVERDREFAIPKVHTDLTTSNILAMDHLPGLPLEDVCGPEHPPELRDRTATALMGLVLRELFEFRFVQTDPNFANYLWLPDEGRIGTARSRSGAGDLELAVALLHPHDRGRDASGSASAARRGRGDGADPRRRARGSARGLHRLPGAS